MTRAVSPRSLDEAVRYLADDPDLIPVGGCTDLMVTEPERRAKMTRVMDLLGIAELRGIRRVDGALEIGAATTFSAIRTSADVRALFPALAKASAVVGGWQIQNRATIGGNMANASPAGDSLPVLLALDALVIAAGSGGTRGIPYSQLHVGYRQTALRKGEIIARVRIPFLPPGTVQDFTKVGTREAQAISKVVVAMVGREDGGRIADLRLAAGSVAPTPVRLARAEAAVRGQPRGEAAASTAGRVAAEEVSPLDDVRSTAAYRRFALERVVRRLVLAL